MSFKHHLQTEGKQMNQLQTVLDALISLANAHFPDERSILTDDDVKAANEAIAIVQQMMHAEPVAMELEIKELDKSFLKITPLPYFVSAARNEIGLLEGRWTRSGAFSGVSKDSVGRHGGSARENVKFLCLLANSWPKIRNALAAPQAVPAHLEEQPDGSVVDTRNEPQAGPAETQTL
jgi:hypothetical protein